MYSFRSMSAAVREQVERFSKDGSLIYIDYQKNRFRADERRGAGVEYHFQEFNQPYAPS